MHHALARKLAAMGYTCFSPAYRLSTEALYPAAVIDVKSVIRFVRSNAEPFYIDVGKVVIAGHSAGGELAAFAGTTANDVAFKSASCLPDVSDEVQAVIDIDGTLSFVHPESGEGDDSKKTSAATYWFGFSKNENPELWKQASPLTHAGPKAPPFLFINSSVARMHAGMDDFISILSSHHIASSVQRFDDAPHTFCFFEPWFTPMVDAMHEFLTKTLTR
jgi:pectinesterase